MKKLILLIAIAAQVALVQAQLTILDAPVTTGQLVTSVTGGDPLSVGPGTAGFSFTTGTDQLIVQGLGVFDLGGTGLTASHKVGLWDATTQTLLTSVTVPATGATDINNFWYMPVTALTLQPSHSYVLAAQYADVDFDLTKANSTATLSGATFGNALLSSGIGFSFPDLTLGQVNAGFFGPNMSFAPVPEPAAWAGVTAIGLAALAAIRRWKARQSTGAAVA
jgi:hypothetical protein